MARAGLWQFDSSLVGLDRRLDGRAETANVPPIGRVSFRGVEVNALEPSRESRTTAVLAAEPGSVPEQVKFLRQHTCGGFGEVGEDHVRASAFDGSR